MTKPQNMDALLAQARKLQQQLNDLQAAGQRTNELKIVTRQLADSIKSMPAPVVNIDKPLRWYFTVERDASGKIDRVIASSDGQYGK